MTNDLTIPPFRTKVLKVKGDAPCYEPDRYGLRDMEVGDQIFVALPSFRLSPYCSYLKKTGKGVWRTMRTERAGRIGTTIVRLK